MVSHPFPFTRICVAVLLAFCPAEEVLAATDEEAVPAALSGANDAGTMPRPPTSSTNVEFDSAFLPPQSGIDVRRFERGNPVLPGDYRVDLYLNGQTQGRTNITVKLGDDPYRGRVCMTRMLLDQVGLDWNKLDPSALKAFEDPAACVVLEERVPDARADLDTSELRLDLALPQSVLSRTPRGYVSSELWDSGVTGGMLSYTFNAYRNESAGFTTDSAYLGLNAGVNLGDWHLRHNGAQSWQSGLKNTYYSINTYAERDIASIAGRLTLGEGFTTGNLFNTQGFRGVQLASDDRMLPDSQRGYAPIVSGIAETNARVTIRQRGTVIYDTPVPPGPFVIDDLFPLGYGGDLEVTVTEGDGRVRTFIVPYASIAQLLRPGTSRYNLTGGTLRNTSLSSEPKFFEAAYQRGLSNYLTGYGGFQASEQYAAVLGGIAVGTPAGALSFDVTGSRTRLPDSTRSGANLRLGYNKLFVETVTNVSIMASRFSSRAFMDMASAIQAVSAARWGMPADVIARPRHRLTLTFNQSLKERWGQFFVSGFVQDYWNAERKDVQFQLGYSNNYRSLAYTLSVNRVRSAAGNMDNQVMFNLSMPLGGTLYAPRLGMNVTNQAGDTNVQATLSGVAGEDNQWSYGATVSNGPGSIGTAGTLNGQYISPKTTAMAGYGAGRGYSNASFGLSGSVVAHPEGVTLSPYTGETVAVVAAPDAAGARVLGYSGVKLDARGYGVVPYLTPYRINEVTVDPKGIPLDVELKTTTQQITPHAGAIVLLRYPTVSGRAVLIDATLPDGSAPPFGADVVDEEGNLVGAVGQGGSIYARLPANEALLTIRWGQAPNQQCVMQVALPETVQRDSIERMQLSCAYPAAPVIAAVPVAPAIVAMPAASAVPVAPAAPEVPAATPAIGKLLSLYKQRVPPSGMYPLAAAPRVHGSVNAGSTQ
ncbi:MAG: fimbrial biogenesis outer membrane usher protein [Betaproteobacteria bacterium]|nr:fimbrial biogenesis outer membrane usher protein [Betaproteobacteria bacterium]